MNDIQILHRKAEQAFNQKQYQLTHQYVLDILKQDKSFADGYFLLAMVASVHHNIDKAIELIERALKFNPKCSEYLAHLAKHYALKNEPIKAIEYARQATNNILSSALTLDTIGVSYSQIGLHAQAIPLFEKAVEKEHNNPSFYFNLAVSQAFIGDFKAALRSHRRVVALAPKFCKSHLAISSLSDISEQNNNIEILAKLFQEIRDADDKLCIGHAIAKEYEVLENYSKAYEYLQRSKQSKLININYHFAKDEKIFTALHHHFTNNKVRENKGHQSKEALFVVGMPRTGTTLIERILSNHEDVTSVGELNNFALLFKEFTQTITNDVLDQQTIIAGTDINDAKLGQSYIDSTRAISGKSAKFVDKMPFNVLYVGFILQALPNAKIVCLDRNPLDTIVSNYRQLFTANSKYYNYAYSLETTTDFYIEFERLAKLWLKLFPDNFYLVNYETLVNNPEEEAKKLLEFCGLDWQASCLAIHQNSAPVATASAVQVRSPITNKSVGNWRKYEDYLDNVKQRLKQANVKFN